MLVVFAAMVVILIIGQIWPAQAAIDTTTGSSIDLAPILNPLIQAAGVFMSVAAPIIVAMAIDWLRKKSALAGMLVDKALQDKISAGAQTAIGGAISRLQIKPGELTVDVHNAIVADAADTLAKNFGDTLTTLGSKDNIAKAVEVIQNRLGMMTAAAAGTPIPNPSTTPSVPIAAAPVVAAPAIRQG
jgi:hypothetical protein